jgi:hypothetical protein
MNEDLKTLHESKNYDEIYNLIETKFSQFEFRWNSVLASEEGVKLYRNTKLSPNQRDKIYRKMFTELIVRECLDVMSKTSEQANKRFTYMGDDVPTVVHQMTIEEHFGVEL